jgi:hypothetical protein
LLLLVLIVFKCSAQIKVELLNDTELTKTGLYFEGTKGIDYQFGKQITPHGDCIDVINGYVFVTWYKGGMDKRNLMVSRKKIDGGDTYRHFKSFLRENKLFLYLMKVGSGDAQPVTLLTFSITDEDATKIKTQKNSSLKIYPNPTTGRINIEGLKNGNFISVYNLMGQIEVQFAQDSQKLVNSFNVSNLQDGIYFIKTENSTVKFVKRADSKIIN